MLFNGVRREHPSDVVDARRRITADRAGHIPLTMVWCRHACRSRQLTTPNLLPEAGFALLEIRRWEIGIGN